jgi:DNA-binding CsgD family transcriptional regulator
MVTLEDCINPGCCYELDFDAYALGYRKLTTGNCPNCDGACIFFCPACGRLQPTRHFIANQNACSRCDGKLPAIAGHRKRTLVAERTRKGGTNEGTPLAPHEREVLRLLAEGRGNKEIANILSLTVRTVDTYRTRIMFKVNVHSVVELVHYALAYEVVPLERIISRFFR